MTNMPEAKKELLKANPKVVCRQEDEEALLFDPENGTIKLLNYTGYDIWKLCDGTRTLENITEKLKAEYPDVALDTLKKDSLEFINLLQSLNWIEDAKERELETNKHE
jgi:hypothetical protein